MTYFDLTIKNSLKKKEISIECKWGNFVMRTQVPHIHFYKIKKNSIPLLFPYLSLLLCHLSRPLTVESEQQQKCTCI